MSREFAELIDKNPMSTAGALGYILFFLFFWWMVLIFVGVDSLMSMLSTPAPRWLFQVARPMRWLIMRV